MYRQKIALTIAGSDPTGGAGFQADLKTFQALGVYGISIPAVLTAQNTNGVLEVKEIDPFFFSSQIDTLLIDSYPDALKTGMLYSSGIVKAVAEKIRTYDLKNLVIDPVHTSTSGTSLMEEGVLDAMTKHLFPIAKVITPNMSEASALTALEINNEDDMKKAAIKLLHLGPEAVVVTGGHLKGKAVDILFDGTDFLSLEQDRIDGEFHGTGCVFSSAITACLALDYEIKEAFIKAKDFVWKAMKTAVTVGKGMKILNV
ncbi:MAG: bifunctional hydroxymethylpyrimidine kinase/phosphomethylpyrimidine kinase [Nitrospiraceae bacterium]|nr:MAG: bifunctional hydroxymethylpyrimidine kinase/phosphomethylpyrimidine kinase [Nitrospiraceae bacterium]